MKLQIEAKDLNRIAALAGVAVQRSTSPIMEAVRIEARGNALYCTGARNEYQVTAWCEASVPDGGSVCVNAQDFRAVSQRLNGVVTISSAENTLSIKSAGGSAELPVAYGEHPKFKADAPKEVEGGVDAFKRAAKFCSKTDLREYTHGVFFANGHVYSTDTSIVFSDEIGHKATGCIPADGLSAISKIGGRLFVDDRNWICEAEGVRAIGLCLSVARPEFERFIADGAEVATCDASDLLGAVEAATLGRAAECFFDWDDGFVLSGGRFPGAHVATNYRAQADGTGGSFVLSTKLISGCLSALGEGVVSLSVCGPGISISPEGSTRRAVVGVLRDARNNLPIAA